MAIDKLRYESQNVSIAREVQKYPKHLGIREVIQNSIEGDGKTGASDIQILSLQTQSSELTGNAPKLAVWDNGPGMDAQSLKTLTDMASSTKQMRGSNNVNFGRGEIVSTLSYNEYGVWWISCKNDRINLVWIRKSGQDYGRHQFEEACDINNSTVVTDITEDSVLIDSFKEQYPGLFDTDKTWTLKVFLGDTDAQDTCKFPFGNNATRNGINWAYNELYKRYHHMPGSNFKISKQKKSKLVIDDKKVQITFNEGTIDKSQGKTKVFSTKSQNFTKTLKGGINGQLDAEQEVRTDAETGISVVFDFDGYQKNNTTGKRASWNTGWRPLSGQSVSIVYHGEMYDRRDGNKFHPFMRNFGAYKGADQFSITIMLPKTYDAVYPDSDRQVLKWETVPTYSGGEQDEAVTVYDFDEVIRRTMPEWFQKKISETRKSFKPSEDMQSRLQEYISLLLQNDKSSSVGKTSGGSSKKGDGTRTRGPNVNERKGTGKGGIKGRKEGSNTFIPPTPVPQSESDFNDVSRDSKFKSANYVVSQNEVLINTEYSAIKYVVNRFVEEYQNDALASDVNEAIYERITQLVIDEFSFKLLCSVINGMMHKRRGKWEEGDVDSVYLNPTALSSVSDSLQDYILEGLAKKVKDEVTRIKNVDKTIQAQEVDQQKWVDNGVKLPEVEVA